ncbi:MAG: TIGR04283 family arsenosugar biosynthesis glycosyltransferase [Hyphomonadaceae bacterium]
MLSIVIIARNAAQTLPATLASLMPGVSAGLVKEAILVDCGSEDATRAIADEAGCVIVESTPGRGRQLRAGGEAARAPWLLFLHADTRLASGWEEEALAFMNRPDADDRAGAFTLAFDDASLPARWVAFWAGLRARILKLPYGDQGLIISRTLYDALGGYRELPLMEDVEIVRRIGGRRLLILKTRAITSGAKFRRDGYLRRASRNLVLLSRYLLGADPHELARRYD